MFPAANSFATLGGAAVAFFSIAEPHIEAVRRYIRRQEEHHRTGRLNATLERTFLD